MYTFPELSTRHPVGGAELELVAGPGWGRRLVAGPGEDRQRPGGVTFSTMLLPWSAMYTFPELSTATPAGALNFELVAGPGVGAPAVPVPAMIDRVPRRRDLLDPVVAGSAM